MNGSREWLRCAVLTAVVLALGLTGLLAADDTLTWHKDRDRVDADVRGAELVTVLEKVARATGWEIYLDPGAERTVSARFNNYTTGEAMRSLLGNLNYAVIPQTNGPSQLYVFRTGREQATRLVRAAQSATAQPIANQLVVTLKSGSKTKIDDLARSLGAKVIRRMDGQNAYLLEFDDAAAAQSAREQLLDNPDVASVDQNFPVDRPPPVQTSASAGADLQLKPVTNNGDCQLVIGLIDTPVQGLPANLSALIRPAIQVVGKSQLPVNQLTHGTAMAETMLRSLQSKTGGSTSVQIQPVDVYGNNQTTTTFDVASGIVQAVNSGANIINLSLGSAGDSSFLHNTIIQVSQRGIPIYAAAGNEPVTTPVYPAAYPEVLAVSASDKSGNIADYANRGSFVKIVAPGDNVVRFNGQNYLVQGTSTSTAFTSGMAAGLADTAHVCADQAQALLQKSLNSTAARKP